MDKKAIITVLVIAGAAAGGYYGWKWFKKNQAINKAKSEVKK